VLQPVAPPSAGITVTVLDDTGLPLQGALVHIMREANNSAPVGQRGRIEVAHRTDNNGIAFFTNEEIGSVGIRYGINVTHPDFVSTAQTSTLGINIGTAQRPRWVPVFERDNANQIQQVEFRFTERSAPLRAFGWEDILQGMGTLAWRTNSIFGWREMPGFGWHNGLDFNLPGVNSDGNNLSTNHRIYSAFRGRVTDRYSNRDSRGYGVTIRFPDPENGVNYYMRYMHMIKAAYVNNHTYVYAGTLIGRVGNTGNSQNDHLHIDVHRVRIDVGFDGTNRAQQIDPHAFFPPGFVNPRPQIANR